MDPTENETFSNASDAIPSEYSQWDLDKLGASRGSSQSDLARQSLYVKFDPLVGGPQTPIKVAPQVDDTMPSPSTPTAPDQENPATPNLLSLETPKPAPQRKDLRFSESSPLSNSKPKEQTVSISSQGQPSSSTNNSSSAQEELQFALIEIEDLQRQLTEQQEQNKQMAQVVEEYQSTMQEMLSQPPASANTSIMSTDGAVVNQAGSAEMEQENKDLKERVKQLEEDLRSTESAFTDLHRKYEKAKVVIDNQRQNEAKLKEAMDKAKSHAEQADKRYLTLKQQAEEKIKEANTQIHSVQEDNKAQISVLQTKLKKTEMHVKQLERTLKAKEEDNAELTAICDDLVKQLEEATS